MRHEKYIIQAGAELGQAQVKLDAVIEVRDEVGNEVVKFSSTTILGSDGREIKRDFR